MRPLLSWFFMFYFQNLISQCISPYFSLYFMIYFPIYNFTLILLIFLVHIFVFSDTFFDFSGCILLSLIFRQFFILPNLFLNHNFSQCIIIFPFSHSILHFSAPLHFRVSSYLRWRRIEACQDFIKTYTLAEDFSPSSRSFWRDRFLLSLLLACQFSGLI